MLSCNLCAILLFLFLSQSNGTFKSANNIKEKPLFNSIETSVLIKCHDDSRSNCTVWAQKGLHSNESYLCVIHSKNQERTQYNFHGRFGDMLNLSEKVVLAWQEFLKNQSTVKFGILNLNNCTITLPNFTVELVEKITVHKSWFDIFYKNSTLCGEKLCQTSFDSDGRIRKPNLKDKCSHIIPISSDFSKETLVYLCMNATQDDNMLRSSLNGGWIKFSELFETSHLKHPIRDGFYFIKSDGTKLFLTEDNGNSFTSTTRGLISICTIYDTYINCSQFDIHGGLKFNRILSGGSDDYIEILDMRNLPEGGFLLLLKEFWDCTVKNGLKDMCHHVTLGKFDAKGKIAASTVVEGYYGSKMDVYEDKDGHYCTVSSHARKSSIFWIEKKVNFSYKCFNVTDLSQRPF